MANSEGLQVLLEFLAGLETDKLKDCYGLAFNSLFDDEQSGPENHRKPKALRAYGAYEAIKELREAVEALKTTR